MSKIADNIRMWTFMAGAIECGNWDRVNELCSLIIENIKEIKSAHGIYVIGFQRIFDAPDGVKKTIEEYNKLVLLYHEKERKKKK